MPLRGRGARGLGQPLSLLQVLSMASEALVGISRQCISLRRVCTAMSVGLAGGRICNGLSPTTVLFGKKA